MINNRPIDQLITSALKEDTGRGDITTNTLISKNQISNAFIVTREAATIYGIEIAKAVFRKLDRGTRFQQFYKDGAKIRANSKILGIRAKTRAILTGERVALNFLGQLSGVATKTALFLEKVRPYKVRVMDTRKTTPGLRFLEKQAVKSAGGTNHRSSLDEIIFIKDNHIISCRKKETLARIIARAKKSAKKPIVVEVGNTHDFKKALSGAPNVILLDNMNIAQIKRIMSIAKKLRKRPAIEVSGNVNLGNIRAIAKTGVDRISVGALTHSRKAIDVALEVIS